MKNKSKSKPVYESEIKGAAGNITNAYNQAAPGLQAGADKFGGVLDSVMAKYNAGDPAVEAARGYTTDVLGGKYLDAGNPQLAAMIDQTGRSVSDRVNASIGTRGLTGGSSHSGILAQQLADAEGRLRYDDYNNERTRMGQAVSQVPGLVAAENGILDPAFAAYDAMQAPVRAAVGAGQGVGGLLSQYTKTSSKGSLAGLLAQMAGNAAQAYAGGG